MNKNQKVKIRFYHQNDGRELWPLIFPLIYSFDKFVSCYFCAGHSEQNRPKFLHSMSIFKYVKKNLNT